MIQLKALLLKQILETASQKENNKHIMTLNDASNVNKFRKFIKAPLTDFINPLCRKKNLKDSFFYYKLISLCVGNAFFLSTVYFRRIFSTGLHTPGVCLL